MVRSDPDYAASQDWMQKKQILMKNRTKFWKQQMTEHLTLMDTDKYYKNIGFAFMKQFQIPLIQLLPRAWKERFKLNLNLKDPKCFDFMNSELPHFSVIFNLGSDMEFSRASELYMHYSGTRNKFGKEVVMNVDKLLKDKIM